MSFLGLFEKIEDGIRPSERMQQRPVPERLNGIIGAIERAPSRSVEQVSALVYIFLSETLNCDGVVAQQFAFEQSPGWRRHGCFDVDRQSWTDFLRFSDKAKGDGNEVKLHFVPYTISRAGYGAVYGDRGGRLKGGCRQDCLPHGGLRNEANGRFPRGFYHGIEYARSSSAWRTSPVPTDISAAGLVRTSVMKPWPVCAHNGPRVPSIKTILMPAPLRLSPIRSEASPPDPRVRP
jgi:hypothetical protein